MGFLRIDGILLFSFAILPFVPELALSEELTTPENIQKEVANNVCDEYVTCAAYYSVMMNGLRYSDREEDIPPVEQAYNQALYSALVVAKTGRSQEMAKKVVMAKFELNVKDMYEEIGKDYGNVSILINKCGHRCKDIIEDPDSLFEEWTSKILERHDFKIKK